MVALISLIQPCRLLIAVTLLVIVLMVIVSKESTSASVMTPDRDINVVLPHATPRGVWSDGSTMWVADNENATLVGYNLATGHRLSNKDIPLPSYIDKPTGIWSDGTVIWVVDWDDTKLYACDLDTGDILGNRDINLASRNDAPRGVWGFGNLIYVVDKDDTYVYAYRKSDGQRQRDEDFDLAGPNGQPWGIWGDGEHVWISDIDDGMLYGYTTSTDSYSDAVRNEDIEVRLPYTVSESRGIWSDGDIMWVVNDTNDVLSGRVHAMYYRDFRHMEDEFSVSDVNTPTGLWTDGETMWVADAGRTDYGKLLAYDLSNGTRDSSKDVQLDASVIAPLSLWSNGTNIWVLADSHSNDFLYAFALDPGPGEIGSLVPDKSISLASDNADPKGAWSNGNTVWVSDSEDDKLYAYHLDDRTRNGENDIDLDSENESPGEIWSDGKTIWVLDTGDKHVYAYRRANGDRQKGTGIQAGSSQRQSQRRHDRTRAALLGIGQWRQHALCLWQGKHSARIQRNFRRIQSPLHTRQRQLCRQGA